MMARKRLTVAVMASVGALPWLAASALQAETLDISFAAELGFEGRVFVEKPQHTGQLEGVNSSISVAPEWLWQGDRHSVSFKPYLRLDGQDDERTHVDIRELEWLYVADEWELRLGWSKVFWGVTEFQHLADVVNQTDSVDSASGEEKLGQPMIYWTTAKDWGYLDVLLMPRFRERTFPGEAGRFRSGLVVDTDQTSYASSDGQSHVDLALRWSHTIGDADIGVYYFNGTNRDPVFGVGQRQGEAVLTPHYEQMQQLGFTGQLIVGDWLWKLESIYRDSDSDEYLAAQTGYEYTFYGVNDSVIDMGLIMEYGWDERGEQGGVFQNDLTVGTRLAFNDEAGTEVIAGFSYDLDYSANGLVVEASRRLGSDWKLALEARTFASDQPKDPSFALQNDDYLGFNGTWFF